MGLVMDELPPTLGLYHLTCVLKRVKEFSSFRNQECALYAYGYPENPPFRVPGCFCHGLFGLTGVAPRFLRCSRMMAKAAIATIGIATSARSRLVDSPGAGETIIVDCFIVVLPLLSVAVTVTV